MRIAILHQRLEWAEIEIQRLLTQQCHQVVLLPIESTNIDRLQQFEIVINRIYASVANSDYRDNLKTLHLLEEAERSGIRTINPLTTTRADYSKAFNYRLMVEHGVPTPETLTLQSPTDTESALRFAEGDYPVVLKRDMGGRAIDVELMTNPTVLHSRLLSHFENDNRATYGGDYILQRYHENLRNFDYRIAIIEGRFAYAYSRSLISNSAAERPWIGSLSRGSQRGDYTPSKVEIELAIRASNAIGATLNEVDMIYTEQGPIVIENNPTPTYFENADEQKLAYSIERLATGLNLSSADHVQ
ncbi:hypothetical protein BOW53_12610 [Solemya pervernicosa gill symbiont]|uniref:ATP-grasp domain-containing protein n=2 Tax=Gammaproteobacteria incertae sedis TaxID=118884 RepID=A0A1T2L279_9GAMM|nr:hypothetical protein [Candidatus Reidiella endopervernicosa]OOZ39218.1 hypothetical protein BOW53_12610 [Solemya pervernicosa gill symbiont]QKQ28065.1 hypothetical protein HUE57_18580 [Candidatus Reidiella endopervernicosa]